MPPFGFPKGQRTSIPFLVLGVAMLALVAGMLLGRSSLGSAAQDSTLWQERTGGGASSLPSGYNPLPSLAPLVKQLKPAVVNIYTTQVVHPRGMRRMPKAQDPFFDFFFGEPGEQGEPNQPFFGIPEGGFKSQSLGSGFIISADGYLITNAHVVANATEIKVKLADEQTLDGKVVGKDEKTDLALLKMEPKAKLPFVYLGDSDKLEVGDWVVAIGNPFGLGHTVTAGIISGKDRQIGHGPYDDFLQTDASINPGNSGGPLFDTAGNVVGINTAIIQGGSSVGFAVPINLAKELLPQLKHSGKVTRGWIGVAIQDLNEELASQFGVERNSGALISQVYPSSPAEKAGLKTGDIVLSVNGTPVSDSRQLTNRVGGLPPGGKAVLEMLRDGKRQTITVSLGDRESGEALATGSEPHQDRSGRGGRELEQAETSLGLKLTALTPEKARRLGVDPTLRGLVVEDVDGAGPTAGFLRPGDVIVEVNRVRVTSLNEFQRALEAGKKSQVLLLVQRGHGQMFVVIQK